MGLNDAKCGESNFDVGEISFVSTLEGLRYRKCQMWASSEAVGAKHSYVLCEGQWRDPAMVTTACKNLWEIAHGYEPSWQSRRHLRR